MPVKPKIPVLIVTGFLGAGKTTFINRVLEQNKGIKIGLIENEFGDVSIDARLMTDFQPESIVELNNGCICCTIYNEFSLTLQELVKKHNHLEHLIIETTGIADPGPIIEPFFQDADLQRIFELNGTVCMVDSVNFLEHIDSAEQQKQIILSDMIVLNKTSQVEQPTLAGILKKIAALNRTAIVVETDYAYIEQLHLSLLQPQLQDEFAKKLKKPFYSESNMADFHSFTLRFGGLLHEIRFSEWFRYFASLHRTSIFRIKGIVHFINNPLAVIVQSVGGAISITEGSVMNPNDSPENTIVFIGKGISKYEIEKEMQEFLLQEN
ncbi:MAG TPA: GTP-binding protein [Prolixibacteraceae bacterium]